MRRDLIRRLGKLEALLVPEELPLLVILPQGLSLEGPLPPGQRVTVGGDYELDGLNIYTAQQITSDSDSGGDPLCDRPCSVNDLIDEFHEKCKSHAQASPASNITDRQQQTGGTYESGP